MNDARLRARQAACAESENWTVLWPSGSDRVYENRHWANYLFQTLQGKRGTLDCSSNTKNGAIGIRALGDSISSLPVIATR